MESASLMVPLDPSSNRSLKKGGVVEAVLVQMRVSPSASISSRRCQSEELRASRETSRPRTRPTSPKPTAATRRWKPRRVAVGARLTEFAVDDDDLVGATNPGDGPFAQPVLTLGALGVLEHLAQRALANVEVGEGAQGDWGGHLQMLLRGSWLAPRLAGQDHLGQEPHQLGALAILATGAVGALLAPDGLGRADGGQGAHPGGQARTREHGPAPGVDARDCALSLGPARLRAALGQVGRHRR